MDEINQYTPKGRKPLRKVYKHIIFDSGGFVNEKMENGSLYYDKEYSCDFVRNCSHTIDANVKEVTP